MMKMLAVFVSDVEVDGEYQFERRLFGSNPEQLGWLAEWLLRTRSRGCGDGIDGAVLETGLESAGAVLEAGAPKTGMRRPDVGIPASGTGAVEPRAAGRENDFPDAERLVKRLVANKLILSFVPDAEQRLWRTVMRRKYQLIRNRVQLRN